MNLNLVAKVEIEKFILSLKKNLTGHDPICILINSAKKLKKEMLDVHL